MFLKYHYIENLWNHLEEEGMFEMMKAHVRYVYILGFDKRNILRILKEFI